MSKTAYQKRIHFCSVLAGSLFAGKTWLVTILLACIVPLSASADTAPTPRGWDEQVISGSRIITKESSIIEVSPWINLGGQSPRDYLNTHKKSMPAGAVYKSASAIQRISDSSSLLVQRKVVLSGAKGLSVLLICTSQSGLAKLISMTVEEKGSKVGDLNKAGVFADAVCNTEPDSSALASAAPTVESAPASQTQSNNSVGSNNELSDKNNMIPPGNRPVSAAFISKDTISGLPPMLVVVPHMMMTFPNGNSTYCVNWNLINQTPTLGSIGSKTCEVSAEKPDDLALEGFKPGETIELSLGRVSGATYNFGGTLSARLNSGDLLMTKDGRIAVGSTGYMTSSAYGNVGTGKAKKGMVGRYFLNGYTITIEAEDGQVYHTFIGALKGDDGRVDSIFLADKYYYKNK